MWCAFILKLIFSLSFVCVCFQKKKKDKKIKLYFYPIFLKSNKLTKINFLNNHLKIVNVRQIKKLRGRVAIFFSWNHFRSYLQLVDKQMLPIHNLVNLSVSTIFIQFHCLYFSLKARYNHHHHHVKQPKMHKFTHNLIKYVVYDLNYWWFSSTYPI